MLGVCNNCHQRKNLWVKKKVLCKPCYEHIMGFSSIKYMHKKRFGGLRETILKRDNYICQDCGMTNAEHFKKWNRQLTIDHVDKNGRNSKNKNHSIENMIALCLSCHSRKDILMYWRDKNMIKQRGCEI